VFPVGSVLSKVFYFDDVPKETRLLVRHEEGDWAGYVYQWREDGSDADLLDGAKSLIEQGIEHIIPSRVQCVQCHVGAAGSSLGPEDRQMNRFVAYQNGADSANQIATLQHIGILDSTATADPADIDRLPDPADTSGDLVDRAKSYLHANCANCHRPGGPGRGPMDFRYEVAHEDMGACNVAVTTDDFGDPNVAIIVPGDASISAVNIRTSRLNLGAMPPLGKQVVDSDGAALLDQYVSSLASCP
jgi:mono/diheme cytochrome c family protein